MSGAVSETWKAWERRIAAEARAHGLSWERRLRGGDHDDLLDIDGPLPMGLLIGGKALSRTGNLADRLSDSMLQCDRAMVNLSKLYPALVDDVVPFQIVQRQGFTVGDAYAVTKYRHILRHWKDHHS